MSRWPSRAARDRVVLIHSSDELYGSDRMVLQVIDSMPEDLRARLVVVLPRNGGGPGELTAALGADGVDVRHRALPILRRRELSRPTALAALLWRTLTLAWWLRAQRPVLVYAGTSAVALGVVAARLAGAPPTVAHVQEVWGRREGQLLGPLIGAASRVVATSSAVMEALPERVKKRALVVENGIATPDRELCELPATGLPRFLVASRWSPRKGYETLFRAWDSLETPPGTLVVAGSPPAAGAGVDVPALAADLRCPESVQIVGQVDSIFDLLDEVDAVIVPSDQPEAFGLIAVEAFSRGRAVIGAAAGGLDAIIDHGVNGLKFPPGDSSALSALLRRTDRKALAQLGESGLRAYEARYSSRAFAERMADVWSAWPGGSIAKTRPNGDHALSAPEQFGVVIAAFNAAATIQRAVRSALESGAFEVLVVDDGSTDETSAIAESAGARVVRQDNAGAASARRTGLRNVTTPWVVFLDADDRLVPAGVSTSLKTAAAATEPVIVSGVAVGETADGGRRAYQVWNRPITAAELIQRGYAPGPPGTFLWPREVITEAMFGPEEAVWPAHAEDYELLIRGASKVPVVSHADPTLEYALEGGKSAVVPTNSVECSERIRSHYSTQLGIPYKKLSPRQIRGRARVRSAKTLAANGAWLQWATAVAQAAALDPRFVVHLAWRGLLSRLRQRLIRGRARVRRGVER